jgi:cysteine desulfurase
MHRIYLDNNATTMIDPLVREAMLPYLTEHFGNPSSGHRHGEIARQAVEKAREQVAELAGCRPRDVFFTSGGTESNNMAIFSALAAFPEKRSVITSNVEHPSVLEPLAYFERQGYSVDRLGVDDDGNISLEELEKTIRPDTVLVSLMAANNETGVTWDLEKIGGICRQKEVLFHCDAVQLAGKAAISMEKLPVDYLAMAAHKMHGPKGCGALCVQPAAPVFPLIRGAGQERNKRAGTENVPGVVGYGKAAELALQFLACYREQTARLRDRMEQRLLQEIPHTRINGAHAERLPNTCNVSFKNTSSAAIIQELDEHGISVSAHSACHSGNLDPSHVLTAMHIPENYVHGTLRISLSRQSTETEIENLLSRLPGIIARSRTVAVL